MPLIISPKDISYPEIPYDKTLVSLSIAPVINGSDIDAAMSLTATPYRVLPDGKIEANENLRRFFNYGSVFIDATQDQTLADAAQGVWAAIQGFLTAKGV